MKQSKKCPLCPVCVLKSCTRDRQDESLLNCFVQIRGRGVNGSFLDAGQGRQVKGSSKAGCDLNGFLGWLGKLLNSSRHQIDHIVRDRRVDYFLCAKGPMMLDF